MVLSINSNYAINYQKFGHLAPPREVSYGSPKGRLALPRESSWYTFWLFIIGFATFAWKFHLL